jgi:hypothetical protein
VGEYRRVFGDINRRIMRNKLVAYLAMLTAIVGVGTMPSIAEEIQFTTDYCYTTITVADGYANWGNDLVHRSQR